MADSNAGTDQPHARRAGWTVVARRVTWEGQTMPVGGGGHRRREP